MEFTEAQSKKINKKMTEAMVDNIGYVLDDNEVMFSAAEEFINSKKKEMKKMMEAYWEENKEELIKKLVLQKMKS